MIKSVRPSEVAESLVDLWSPKVIGSVDDSYVKVARLKGKFTWHDHADEDELFFVLKGALRIEMRDGVVELEAGEMYIVPKGVQHRPESDEGCLVMLIERKTTLHTGTAQSPLTRTIEEQLDRGVAE